MIVAADTLAESMRLDLEASRLALTAVRDELRRKDTPEARRRLADRQAVVDDMLDMWLAASGAAG